MAPSAPNQHLPDPTKEKFLKKTMKELTTLVSNEWLGEPKLSPEVIHLDSPSTSIRCQIHKTSFNALYNPIVGVNLMSKSFAHTLPENFQLTPTTKLLKSLLGQILPSKGIFHLIPIKVDGTKVYLSFYVFDIWEFDLLIGHPIERLLHQGSKASINASLGKSLNLSIVITRSLHVKIEMSPEQDPMEEIMAPYHFRKHHSALGYLLEDLKGISYALCTHRIPIDPAYPPSREPQRRLNNMMREVVKEEILKLFACKDNLSCAI